MAVLRQLRRVIGTCLARRAAPLSLACWPVQHEHVDSHLHDVIAANFDDDVEVNPIPATVGVDVWQ